MPLITKGFYVENIGIRCDYACYLSHAAISIDNMLPLQTLVHQQLSCSVRLSFGSQLPRLYATKFEPFQDSVADIPGYVRAFIYPGSPSQRFLP